MLFQESWMCEGSRSDDSLLKLRTHVGSTEAVANTDKLGLSSICVPACDSFHPRRNSFVGKGGMLALPSLVVKVGVSSLVLAVLSVLPYGVLSFCSDGSIQAQTKRTYTSEVV